MYAREVDSLEHARSTGPSSGELRLAPDFTALLPGTAPFPGRVPSGAFCLIPNIRMLEKTPPEERETYTEFLAEAMRCAHKHGRAVIVLVHDQGDLALCRSVVAAAGVPSTILEEPDPLAVKGIIGSCALVLSSRFHGLVNALSQGVPACATSWSHKYGRLLEEYGVPDLVMNPMRGAIEVEAKLSPLFDQVEHTRKRAIILARGADIRLGIERMWDDVIAILRMRKGPGW